MKRVHSVALLFFGPLASLVVAPLVAQEAEFAASPAVAVVLPEAPQPQLTLAPLSAPAGVDAADGEAETPLSLRGAPKRVLLDEVHIFTSPARIRTRDLKWLLPLAAATGVSLATDTHVMRDVVSHDPNFNSANDTTSSIVRDVFIGAPLVLFGEGQVFGRSRERETGMLAGEAMLDGFITDEVIKFATLRERPAQFNARGHFFVGGAASDPSFISGHSTITWSSAAVLAGEYSKPWQQAGIYTLASSVSLTRVLAQQHFPTDVLLGSVAGWLIGHYVYRAHHRGSRAAFRSRQP